MGRRLSRRRSVPLPLGRTSSVACGAVLLGVLAAGLALPVAAPARGRADRDGDGLSDRQELRHKTSPRRRDSDRDGLSDGAEVKRFHTSPRRRDSDRDSLSDGDEVKRFHTNPRRRDSDGDGLDDGREVRAHSDPRRRDTDGDGLDDEQEIRQGNDLLSALLRWLTSPHAASVAPATTAATPMDTIIDSGPAATTSSTSASFGFHSTESLSSFECSLDGASFSLCFSPQAYSNLASGTHVFQVRARTLFGGVDASPASRSWTVVPVADTTPPDTVVDSGPSGSTSSTSASFGFHSSESGSSFECRVDGAAFSSCSSPQAYSNLATGAHSFDVRAKDAANNVDASPASRSWTVVPAPDTTPPDTVVDSGPSGTTSSTSASFGFHSTESGSSFECRVDGAAFSSCSSPQAYSNLATGAHSFEVRAKDAANNVDASPASRSWTISSPGGTGPPALQADSLVDSVGVNVHLNYTDTVYVQGYDTIIRPRLIELGLRRVRDGVTVTSSDKINKLRDLGSVGIRSLIVAEPTGTATVTAVKDWIKQLGSSVAAVEGPNEFNNRGFADWVSRLRGLQSDIYSAIKGDPATAHLPVGCPSLTSREAYEELGDAGASCDFGNTHDYYGGFNPGTTGWGSCKYGSCYGSLDHNFTLAQLNAPGKPVLSTETGWHNAVPSNTGHLGTPEVIVGRYMPRLFLLHLQKGVPQSYPYELIDEWNAPGDSERSFGLLRYDGTPKPAFNSVKAMIGLLKDPGPSFTPDALDYTVNGNTTDVKTMVFQKRNGSFYLAIWQEVPGNVTGTSTLNTISPRPVSISLPTSYSSATVHTLSDAGTMSSAPQSISGSLPLSVTDRVTFVQLGP